MAKSKLRAPAKAKKSAAKKSAVKKSAVKKSAVKKSAVPRRAAGRKASPGDLSPRRQPPRTAEPPIRPTRAPSRAQPAPKPSPPEPPSRAVRNLVTPPLPPRVVPAGPPGEVAPARDVGRLLRYGEQFGAHRIELRHLPAPVIVTTGQIAILDPGAPARRRVLARQVASGRYRVMLCAAGDRIAAAVLHLGRPPIARWVIAHHEGGKPPKTADQPPLVELETGVAAFADAQQQPGPDLVTFDIKAGAYAAYWALDAAGQPVCLVIDFDVFTKADWKLPKRRSDPR